MIKNSSASIQKEKSKCVIFVIDASNSPAFLAETAVHFIEVLNYLKSTKKPGRVLIVYSKIDLVPKDSSAIGKNDILSKITNELYKRLFRK